MTIKPGTKVPFLSLPVVNGERFELFDRRPEHFTMLIFYRGRHCPICKTYISDLDRKIGDFAGQGVEVIAASTDGRERAEATKRDWAIERLPLAYDLSIDQAREWGLFISRSIKAEEPELFAEPGLFLIRPDGTLHSASIQTMPFARPAFADVLQAVAFVIEKNYPPRGGA